MNVQDGSDPNVSTCARTRGYRRGEGPNILGPVERHLEVIDALRSWREADRQSTGILGQVELEFL